MAARPVRCSVPKTYKLFIAGKFPRSESGRTLKAIAVPTGSHLAHYAHASRKDLRDAVAAARAALPAWSGTTPYLRGQVLYRAAEMLESRSAAVAAELVTSTGATRRAASSEVAAAVDRLVYFAGWADKFAQVFSQVNPVSSPHFCFSSPEPMGVVGVVAPDEPCLLALAGLAAEVVVSGNTAVLLASERFPLPALAMAEAFATSDLPGGVVNILTGRRAELAPAFASHRDLNALVEASGDPGLAAEFRAGTATNLKRVSTRSPGADAWRGEAGQDPYRILDCVETKTAWHPSSL
jgi:acyl-CoA reductase-like NAD-dependent aldehyde dehydrogenase